ncbi:MAG: GNAT family N-acetyltransferase [Chloroflexi bacterium]|jgi:GNAT superfamily N-acetyltransferase|nr:GNAT family N-acetyltransferase [Chloroflexota bacterium]MBT7082168.1 GNAT family N-acetyltransferase [Chloroflexota bacterium]MBT7290051.1 GNAT family N-acetyltransferase [Chloroflexota bacterium]
MITIDVAERKHIPQILHIWEELMDYHARIDTLFEVRKDGAKNWERYLRDLMRSKESRIFIAVEDDEVIGYSVCRVAAHPPFFKQEYYGLIMDMAVKDGHQRQGIGTKMLNTIYDWVRFMELDRIELQVVPKNDAGCAFWSKHGFTDYLQSLYKKI